ncbi:hypothetical protein GGX14DRAFT_577522 [Mycena pura]|uniref:Uncharacterized protein n=1 Tax=Mycena pura TaxID=153505 RepID=A0AAD6Y659_9AGAR|nr:hypothetical protein GGX14DRAFT_577522 [Mycena pura]
MTPPSTLNALPKLSLEPPLTAGHLLKPLDFTSTHTIFLFPPMSSSKMKAATIVENDLDTDFYVAPVPSRYWSAFNHSASRLFINVLRRLSSNTQVSETVATNAMSVGMRSIRYLFDQLRDQQPPEDILALVGLIHQLVSLVSQPLPELHFIPNLAVPDRLLPENFEVPSWKPPSEMALAEAPVLLPPKKRPSTLSNIAQQPDGDDDDGDGDDDEDEEIERAARTPSPPPGPPKGKRTRSVTRSERKSAEYIDDSDAKSIPAAKALKTKRASNAATQSHQTPAKDSTVVLKNPKDKNDGKPKGKNLIRNVSLTEIKDRVGAAIVSILNTKETFHKRVNLDLPEDAGATITVAVARKGPGVKPPFRSAMGSTPHARARDNDDFESDFAPLEPIPLKEVESLAVGEAQFPPFSCLNCILARVDCQPFGYGVQCSRCQTKRSKNCEHTLSAMELSNLFATIAKQNTFSLEMTKYVIDDLKTSIARAKRDYDSLRLSIAAVEHSICRTIEHARAATDVLGTDGLLSYFEAPKSSQDPDAVDLLNRLIENFNSMKAVPGDSIASTPARQATPAEEGELAPGPSKRLPATPAAKKPSSKAPRAESRVIRDAPEGDNDN